jgi:hypothetical protein
MSRHTAWRGRTARRQWKEIRWTGKALWMLIPGRLAPKQGLLFNEAWLYETDCSMRVVAKMKAKIWGNGRTFRSMPVVEPYHGYKRHMTICFKAAQEGFEAVQA